MKYRLIIVLTVVTLLVACSLPTPTPGIDNLMPTYEGSPFIVEPTATPAIDIMMPTIEGIPTFIEPTIAATFTAVPTCQVCPTCPSPPVATATPRINTVTPTPTVTLTPTPDIDIIMPTYEPTGMAPGMPPLTQTPPIDNIMPTYIPTGVAPGVPPNPIQIVWNGVATSLQFDKMIVTTNILKLDGTYVHPKRGYVYIIIKGESAYGALGIEDWPVNQVWAVDKNGQVWPWKYRCVLSTNIGNVCWAFEVPEGTMLREIVLPVNILVDLRSLWVSKP